MGGYLLFAIYELSGVGIVSRFVGRDRPVMRLWLGMSLGLVMMMWLPALFAFVMDFTFTANLMAVCLAATVSVLTIALKGSAIMIPERSGLGRDAPRKLYLWLVVPFMILIVYLLYTHTVREIDGALYVGQSTYGDLCLHLGIATGLRGASFPPTYTLIEGARLGYPFLSDSLVTSMLLFGSDLAGSFIVSGAVMAFLVFTGFITLAWDLTKRRLAVVIAFLIMFVNGGLGFIYIFDKVLSDPTMLREAFTAFYHTPTNMPAYNLRWVNVICDMMIPQRTLLAGWMCVIPAIYVLVRAIKTDKLSLFIVLGAWAGCMPMIHTHSFVALALISFGALVHAIMTGKNPWKFLVYAIIAAVLALPQLMEWTFPQTAKGGSLGILLNWVNNNGDNTFIDGYFWFWIKNVGVAYLLMLPAALNAGKVGKYLAAGALTVYTVAEVVQFQPNPYDNNKLFYVAYIIMTPLVGLFVAKVFDRLKGLKCRYLFLGALLIVSTLSGAMSIGREVVSKYQLMTAAETGAGYFADEETDKNAVFLTGDQHNNPISALSGRQIVCGTGSYLYFHGIDYSQERKDVVLMYENPADNAALFEQYRVDFVYISSYERSDYDIDITYFENNGTLVYENGNVAIYELSKS